MPSAVDARQRRRWHTSSQDQAVVPKLYDQTEAACWRTFKPLRPGCRTSVSDKSTNAVKRVRACPMVRSRTWPENLPRCLNSHVKMTRIPTAPIALADEEDLPVSRVGTIAGARIEDAETEQQYTVFSMYEFWESVRAERSNWIYADATVHRIISDLSAL
jgi:hypothetical protein